MDFFSRQKQMFSLEENKRLRQGVVFIAGAGGLGTHQAIALQRMGIKKIYITDYDVIEASNLNRQILYGCKDIGLLKSQCAKQLLDGFGLNVEIVALTEKITADIELPQDVDVLLDALDNFAARFALEKIAQKQQLPFIHGGIHSWYAQVATFMPGENFALKDIVGQASIEQEAVPAISPVVAVLANLQALEAIRIIIKREPLYAQKLFIIDLNSNSFEQVNLKANK